MTNAPGSEPAGLPNLGEPLSGTDARPVDEVGAPATAGDAIQGGDNEQQDALRAHAAAQASDQPLTGGLDDTRASAREGSMNDNDTL